MSIALHGIGVSKGIAIGRAHLVDHVFIEVSEYKLSRQHLDDEVIRFEAAIEVAKEQLQQIRSHLSEGTHVDITAFIDTHLMMLEDELLTKDPARIIHEQQCNAEWALKLQADHIIHIFSEMDDPYLSARKNDVAHVVARIQRVLRGYTEIPVLLEQANLHDRMIIADDLSPADTALMQHRGILSFVTEFGGTTSHTAILARSLGIPAIVGLRRACTYIKQNDMLIIDGNNGTVIIEPNDVVLNYYRTRQVEEKRYKTSLNKIKKAPTKTLDGTAISLQTNIEFPEDMAAVRRVGGNSVGLYRTEFLYMNRTAPPDEEEHLDAYTRVIHALDGGTVTIRTVDLGADKQVDGRFHLAGAHASNPALGLRAVRLCLRDLKMFKPQLRAVLRASALGNVRMMIPMVCGPQEIIQVRNLIAELRQGLDEKGIAYDADMPIGVMIEVPALAVCVDLFSSYVDFLSIGTNDLIQYTLAIDRVDDSVNYLYDPIHPAVLRLIKMSIDAANKAEKPISMCGEMASDSRYVRLLLGLGLRSFSVNPEAFLEIKQLINNSDMRGLSRLSNKMLKSHSHDETCKLLQQMNK